MFYSILIVFSIIIIIKTEIDVNSEQKLIKRIAIIGGGVGGSSAAYFLNDLVKTDDSLKISIDLFEKSSQLGGRLATKTLNGKQYETGAYVLEEKNRYAKYLVNQLKLNKQESTVSNNFCIYNEKSDVFCESSWKLITYLKLLFRYGLEINTFHSQVSKVMDMFENIYKLQENNVKFDSLDDMLDSISPTITNLTKTRFNDFLVKSGFSQRLIDELLQPFSLFVTNQDVSIHAFMGMQSFALTGSLFWTIRGGNKQLPKKLAQNSNANILLNTNVIAIKHLGPNLFEVIYKPEPNTITRQIYNSVIIATPLTEKQINFIDFSVNLNENISITKYQTFVTTLVSGTIREKFKGINVLRAKRNSFYRSVTRVRPVDESDDEEMPVYKVQSDSSQIPLSNKQLNTIFEKIKTKSVTDWSACPIYDRVSRPLPGFTLFPGLYYLNAIELVTTSIEMALISGKNTALLVYNQLGGKTLTQNSENIKVNQINDEF